MNGVRHPATHSYAVQLELTHLFDPAAVTFELNATHGPRLRDVGLTVIAAATGRVTIGLTLTAGDLWTAILTCMSLIDHTRYEITSFNATA